MTHPPRECPVCHDSFVPARSDQQVCGATCRQRKRRGTVLATPELREQVADFVRRHGHGHPLEHPFTPEQIRAHVLATADRNPESDEEGA